MSIFYEIEFAKLIIRHLFITLCYDGFIQSRFAEDKNFMEKYKIAAILMMIHGGFTEFGGVLCMIPALMLETDKFDMGQYFEFKLQYFQDNLYLMMVMGAIYGVFRLIGAIGLLKTGCGVWCYR